MRSSVFQQRLFILALLVICIFSARNISAQTLQERLEKQTDFVPHAASPPEQLIEVAQRFQIPMAIEWLEEKDERSKSTLNFKHGSVLELIKTIVEQSPEHQVLNEGRILYIYPPSVAAHQFNFLNLRIDAYAVTEESLLGAQASLRTRIKRMLYPDLYKNGYGGGHGGVAVGVFSEKNITFAVSDMTIREILNRIAVENGNALWIVKLKPDEFTGDKPKWVGAPLDEYGQSPLSTRWQFIPLNDERTDSSRKP